MGRGIKIEEIIKLHNEGKKNSEIAKNLNCSRSNITQRIHKYINEIVNNNPQPINCKSYIDPELINNKPEVNQKLINNQLTVNQIVNEIINQLQPIIFELVNQIVNQKLINNQLTVNQNKENVNQNVNQEKIALEKENIQNVNQPVNQNVNQNKDDAYIYNIYNNINTPNKKEDKEKYKDKENNKKEEKKETIITGNDKIEVTISKKIKEPQPAIQFIFDFAYLIEVNPDRGFIERNVRDAYLILKQYNPNDILGLINWRMSTSEYWKSKITNLSVVYKNISVWIKEFKEFKENKKIITIQQWLNKHPEYKPTQPNGSIERYRELLRIFNLAFKEPLVVPTPEEWEKYRNFRKKLKEKLNGTN
ncbi:MAG: helix-turn-helix domain-containing protein [Spirochaetes bacterium]|nr:helix-turn-helix domain-containing protein [Spirochaetota bacterium]